MILVRVDRGRKLSVYWRGRSELASKPHIAMSSNPLEVTRRGSRQKSTWSKLPLRLRR